MVTFHVLSALSAALNISEVCLDQLQSPPITISFRLYAKEDSFDGVCGGQ